VTVLGTIMKGPSMLVFQWLWESAKHPYRCHSGLHLVLIIKILPRLRPLATCVVDLSHSITSTACVAARTFIAEEY